MSHDEESRVADRGERRRTVRGRVAEALFSLFAALFVAGGLFFGYVFVTTAVSLLTGSPPPAGGLLPGNLFQTGKGAPGAEIVALPEWKGDERLNVLLLGLDQREDERGAPTRSDTMIIATIDPLAKSATLLHIPRDLWVVVPGHGENKINTAHFYGEWERPGSGPALAKKTIEMAFGVRMHYYARVDFRGFEKLVDAIGGVTIDAPKPVKDDEYPEGDYGIRRIYIPAGLQHVDGRVALQYARSRHVDDDVGRGFRQTQVLVAAKSQAMRIDLLPKLPFLLSVLKEAIATDVPAGDLLGLINLGRQIDSKNISTREIDRTLFNDIYGDGTVFLPKWDAIRGLVTEVFYDPKLKAERASIVVKNGTLRDGLAASTGGVLTGRGYTVLNTGNADRSDYREILIVDHSGKKYTVQKLAELLRVSPRNVRSEPGQEADITLVLGQDTRLP